VEQGKINSLRCILLCESLITNEYTTESVDTHTTRQSQILTAFRLKRFVPFNWNHSKRSLSTWLFYYSRNYFRS